MALLIPAIEIRTDPPAMTGFHVDFAPQGCVQHDGRHFVTATQWCKTRAGSGGGGYPHQICTTFCCSPSSEEKHTHHSANVAPKPTLAEHANLTATMAKSCDASSDIAVSSRGDLQVWIQNFSKYCAMVFTLKKLVGTSTRLSVTPP